MIIEAIIFLNTYQLTGMGFRCGLAGKESTCNVRDLDLIPGLGKSPGEGKGYPLQSSHFIFHPYINLVKLTRLTCDHFPGVLSEVTETANSTVRI